MVRFSSLATLLLPLAATAQVLNLIPSNFDTVVFESGKPALVEFFAPWYVSGPTILILTKRTADTNRTGAATART